MRSPVAAALALAVATASVAASADRTADPVNPFLAKMNLREGATEARQARKDLQQIADAYDVPLSLVAKIAAAAVDFGFEKKGISEREGVIEEFVIYVVTTGDWAEPVRP